MPLGTILLIDFLQRLIILSKGPVSFPIISMVKMARKRVLQEISTPIKRYKRLSSDALGNYTQEAAVKLKLNYNFSHFIPFGYRRYDSEILKLHLCK